MDLKNGTGSLACRICSASYQMPIHHLHEPIDVFSEWLDDCEAAERGEVAAASAGAAAAGSGGGNMSRVVHDTSQDYDDDDEDDDLPPPSGLTKKAAGAGGEGKTGGEGKKLQRIADGDYEGGNVSSSREMARESTYFILQYETIINILSSALLLAIPNRTHGLEVESKPYGTRLSFTSTTTTKLT
eukprot:scaffold389_cov211-Alexandrium_tamarense.AAC.21